LLDGVQIDLHHPGDRFGDGADLDHAAGRVVFDQLELGQDVIARPQQLPVVMNPTSESSAPEKAVANARSAAVAASLLSATIVLQESGGAVGPRLARAQRAVVGVFHGTGIGSLVDGARLEQLVQLRDLGRVLLGRRPGPIDHRVALVHKPLARLQRLLLIVQRAGELLDLAPLLRRRFG
jgi:hypothetical protein